MSKCADSKTLLKKKAKIIGLESFLGVEVWGNGTRRGWDNKISGFSTRYVH